VSNELFDDDAQQLRVRVLRLEQRPQVLLTIIRLLLLLVRLAGARLDGKRLPEGENKRSVIRAIERATRVVPIKVALRTIGLSAGRYQDWCRTRVCELDDRTRGVQKLTRAGFSLLAASFTRSRSVDHPHGTASDGVAPAPWPILCSATTSAPGYRYGNLSVPSGQKYTAQNSPCQVSSP
jgi:hypothetical protein